MSKFREPSAETIEMDCDEMWCLENLAETKKLTEKQRKALKKLIQKYYQFSN